MRRPILIGALAFAALLLSSATSGGATAVAECPGGGYAPAWSPSGQEIAWWSAQGYGICFARADGTRELTMSLSGITDPVTTLVWARPGLLVGLSNGYRLFSVSTRYRPHLITHGPRFTGTAGDFSLDATGDMLAAGNEEVGPIHIVRLGRSMSTSIGNAANANIIPSLSPGGDRVTFEEIATGGAPHIAIWTAHTDGTHRHEIAAFGQCPLWSPTGKQIAYIDEANRLVVVHPDGGPRIALATNVIAMCRTPESIAWSPDGRFIGFIGSHHLTVVNVQTKHRWAVPFTRDIHAFAWSPDSSQIFFSAGNTQGCNSLWRAPVRGTGTIRISRC